MTTLDLPAFSPADISTLAIAAGFLWLQHGDDGGVFTPEQQDALS